MPISDEVIELVPAGKSKSKLIIFIVAAAVGIALAVTFLVMYLLKPNVEETPLIVNGVTVTSNELFEINENDVPVKYAAVGQEYTVFANISTENGASKDVDWEVKPSGALRETEKTTGEGAYIKFMPNAEFNDQEVTITARSKHDPSKLAEVKFKVVIQGAESIDVTRYYVQGDPSSAVTVSGDTVSLPLYSTDSNNKTYIMQFEQKGKYNSSTGEYLPVTSIDAENGGKTNDVVVSSSDDKTVAVYQGSDRAFTFKAVKAGTAKINIAANGNNPSGTYNKEITVTVKSNAELGYIDTIRVFNKPIVDAEFIESILNASRTDIDVNKLNQKLREDASLKMNDFALTLPYNRAYADIFKHVLVSPISLQYDMAKKALVDSWSDSVTLTSSNTSVLTVTSQKALNGAALASTENGAASCKLTIADGKLGSLPAKREISVNVVAQNTVGTVKVDGKEVPTNGVATTPDGTSTLTVSYEFRMPGNVELDSLIDLGYITKTFKLDFDKTKTVVTLKGDNKAIEPDTVMTIPTGAMTVTKRAGGSASSSTYDGVIEFTVKTAAALVDGDTYDVTYHKIGTSSADDCDWQRTVHYEVNKVATKAFITTNEQTINSVITSEGRFKGRYVYSTAHPDAIDIYVQNQVNGTDFIGLFDIKQLADADGAFDVSGLTYAELNNEVFSNRSNVISFNGKPPAPSQQKNKSAKATLTVKQAGGTNTVGTLTVNIYVIDAVTEFMPITPKTVNYGRTEFNGISFTLDEIKAMRVMATSPARYTFGAVEISYGTDAHGDPLLLTPNTSGNRTIFSYDGTPLYAYENLTIAPLTDIFAFSQHNKIKFSEIRVRFKLADGDMYIGDSELFGEMLCTFVRKADGIVVATSDNFVDNALQPDQNGDLALTANQGNPVYLLISSVVRISDTESVTVRDKNVTVYADVMHSYIEIPESYNATGSLVSDSKTQFYSATLNAPAVSDPTGEQPHPFNVYYSGFSKKLTLTVQNKARAVSGIAMYSDENCTRPLTDNDLIFGRFIGKDAHYTQTVYVKVSYVTDSADFMYYESAQMLLPDHIEVTVGADTIGGGRTITLTPDCGVHENNEVVFKCELSLESDAERGSGKLTVRQSNMPVTGDGISASNKVVIDTGLKNITLLVDGNSHTLEAGTTLNIVKSFALSDRKDEQKLDLAFVFNALTDGYGGIVYNAANLKVTSDTIDGLIFANGTGKDTAVIKVNLNNLKTMKDVVLTFVIKDETNGTSADNEFTVSVNITVTMDIFALAFAAVDDKFEISTTGGTGAQSQQIDIVYNGGDADIQPENAVKNNMTVDVVKKTGDVYAPYADGFAVEKNGANYILKVENTVLSAQDVFVRISYNGIEKYKQVTIVTKSHHIELAKQGNTVSVTETGNVKTAIVTVDGGADGNKFTLAADVINDGTGLPVAGKKATYAVYTDEQCTSIASHVTIGADGVITIAPKAASETVYYRASYTDVGGTEQTHAIIVAITYRVAVSGVALDGIDANTMSGKTLTLYFADSTDYTYIDLAEFIKASNAFGLAFDKDLDVKVETASSALAVSGTEIRPRSTVASATVTVTATYFATQKSETYTVTVVGMPTLALDKSSGTVDIVKDDSVTITPTYTVPNAFDATYGLTADKNGLTITDAVAPDAKTVKAARAASSIGKYTLTAKVTYTLKSGGSAKLAGNNITLTATYTLDVTCEYVPEFKLYCGETEISPSGANVIQSGGAYKLVVTNTDGHGDTAASYAASATNGILSFTAGGGKEIGFTFVQNASGSTSVKVTATVYGKTFESAAVEYTFTYGLDATAALSVSSDGGSTYAPFGADTHSQAIDFTVNAYKFKYTVTGIDVATVNASDVHISVLGGSASAVTKAADSYYVVITTDKAGTLTVGGYVTVGSRTVYLASYNVELTAVEPDFEFTASETAIDPADTVTFDLTQNASGFMGEFSGNVKYEIVTGGAYATLVGNVLTANSNITTAKTVVVRATVTVANGVFANSVYTFTEEITINGAAMPTIGWNASDTESMNIGESRKFDYTMTADYTADITTSVIGTEGLMGGVDYVFDASNRTLKVNDTQKTRAGGKITLKITAMITSAVHKDTEISDEIDIVITPKISATNVTIGNAANVTTDLADLIHIATVDENGFFIKSTDGCIKSIALKDQADAGVCTIDGSRITLTDNLSSARSIALMATVVMTTGNYAGKSFTCEFTVDVAAQPVVSVETVEWNAASNAYNEVNGADGITIGEVSGNVTVASVEITATGNGAQFVTVDANGSATPTVSVANNANIYIVGAAGAHGDETFPLAYAITLSNGHKYYATGALTVKAVGVTVTAESEDETIAGETLEKYVGDTFAVELTANNGFNVVLTDVTINKPTDGAEMTVSYAGNRAMFVAPASSVDGSYSVTLYYNVGGVTGERMFTVSFTAPTSTQAYTADNTDNTDIKVGDQKTISSTWTYNSGSNSNYKYGYSVTINSPDGRALDTFFESIVLYNEASGGWSIVRSVTSGMLTGTSVTVNFNNSGYNRPEISKFKLEFAVNTDNEIAQCPITVSYRAYNKSQSWSGQYQDISVRYNLRVINEFTVTFDPNGGELDSFTPASIKVTNGMVYGVLPTPTREHYEFGGWYTERSDGDRITHNTVVSLNGDQTIYAKWTAKNYDVVLELNGGRFTGGWTQADGSVKANGNYNIPADNQVERTGYDFAGWYTRLTGGDRVNANSAANGTIYTVLYAHWTPKSVTVSFDTGDPAVTAPSALKREYNGKYGVLPSIERTHYTFVGWFTAVSGGTQISADSTVAVASDITLYAHWTPDTYNVTLDYGYAASGETSNLKAEFTAPYGSEFGLHQMIAPTRDGYVFDGWYNGLTDVTEKAVEVNGNTTLTAHWKRLVTVSFVTDMEGVADPQSKPYTQGDAYGQLPELVKDGQTFLGWFINGGTEAVKATDIVESDVTLTARWQATDPTPEESGDVTE